MTFSISFTSISARERSCLGENLQPTNSFFRFSNYKAVSISFPEGIFSTIAEKSFVKTKVFS